MGNLKLFSDTIETRKLSSEHNKDHNRAFVVCFEKLIKASAFNVEIEVKLFI